jgi:hypothetical protein
LGFLLFLFLVGLVSESQEKHWHCLHGIDKIFARLEHMIIEWVKGKISSFVWSQRPILVGGLQIAWAVTGHLLVSGDIWAPKLLNIRYVFKIKANSCYTII